MKKYMNPEIEVVELQTSDIITTSPGTETPWYEEQDGIWSLEIICLKNLRATPLLRIIFPNCILMSNMCSTKI